MANRWDDFDEVLAAIEGRNPITGRVIEVKPYTTAQKGVVKRNPKAIYREETPEQRAKRNARNAIYMKARRAAWKAKGLTVLGKPFKVIVNAELRHGANKNNV